MPPADQASLPRDVRTLWHRFSDTYEPLRTELYRYCRYLTRSPWDAEDLAQDTLARAFATLGRLGEAPPNPRAWLFRVASNLWIDRVRRARLAQASAEPEPSAAAPPPASSTRAAARSLLTLLAPQERAAVVLKDVFEFSLQEIATTLGTTTGAVKAALHRGRGKLEAPEARAGRTPAPGEPEPPAMPAVVDAFVAAFNAHDLERLTTLLLDTATVEVVGATASDGPDDNRAQMLGGMLFGSARLANAATEGGIEARFVQGALPTPPRVEARRYRGEPIVLVWYAHADGEHVRALHRLTCEGDKLAALTNYFFTPDLIAEVCAELGVPSRSNGHRWWLECPTQGPRP